jgi:hypothetical protein
VNALQRLLDMPITGKLNLFSSAGFVFLLKSGIATRAVIGGTRVVADAPPLNPLPIPEKDKDRTFLERIFTEGVGSLALTYGILYLIQDLAAKVVQTVDKSLAPQTLLEACRSKLNPKQQNQLEQALVETFGGKHTDLSRAHNTIYHNLYGKGKLAKLADALGQPELLQSVGGYAKGLIADEANHFYRNLNGKGVFCLMAGTAMSAWLSGGPLQAWNDGWFRNNVTEKVLTAYTHWKETHPKAEPKPVALPGVSPLLATQPVARPQPLVPNNNTSPWAVVAQPYPATLTVGGLR